MEPAELTSAAEITEGPTDHTGAVTNTTAEETTEVSSDKPIKVPTMLPTCPEIQHFIVEADCTK